MCGMFFMCNDASTTEIYTYCHTLSLLDALPICYGQLLAELDHRIRPNLGLSVTCDGDGTFSPACRTSENPEIVVWGDSYAMHLVQGILASNPSAQVVQLTKSACGPIFGLTPISNKYPIRWSEECNAFTGKVRDWLTSNDYVKIGRAHV